jgi:copper resistance protein B
MLAITAAAHSQEHPHTGHQPETPLTASQPITPADADLPPFIPRVSDEDRRAAFPDVEGHAVHDEALNYFVLLDHVEWQAGEGQGRASLDSSGWIGRDRDRLWFRAEGDGSDRGVGAAGVQLLYGRQVARWWDVVGGVRQDLGSGPARTWAALGIQGLAPYWFDIEATAYVGPSGRTYARFDVEYEVLLTNRLIVQPLVELELFGMSDPERAIGAGLSTIDAGIRLRYELRRELAPYIGVTWNRKYGNTARFAEAAGDSRTASRFVTGVRLWF